TRVQQIDYPGASCFGQVVLRLEQRYVPGSRALLHRSKNQILEFSGCCACRSKYSIRLSAAQGESGSSRWQCPYLGQFQVRGWRQLLAGSRSAAGGSSFVCDKQCIPLSRPKEFQKVGVDDLGVCGTHAVRELLIDL